MRKILSLIIFAISFLIMANLTYAIGISPARLIIDFEPGMSDTYEYSVINSESRTIYGQVYVKGDLKDYVTLYDSVVELSQGKAKLLNM
ncbi:MAG: hypothetical protein PHU12_01165, partial [Candidatus Aenigmarchaeota archaeon]|nr:hypothetical protein [Candidatus Aenigmarchaeota archaeon]